MKAVDFFCSGGGMTNGFRKAGINVVGGIDFDLNCKATYELNNPGSKFIHYDIKELSYEKLEVELNLTKNDDEMIFIGCSPCQYWTKIKTNKAKSEETKNLLKDFQRFVDYFKPGYIVIENVPGILNRIKESPLKSFLEFLNTEKYAYKFNIVNASHYGVPQTRRRFLLIATRLNQIIELPIPDTVNKIPTVRDFIGNKKLFGPIIAGRIDHTNFIHTAAGLNKNNLKRLMLTPHNGGTRIAWKDTNLQLKAYIDKDNSFQDIYGRMFWDKPAPTITTKFFSLTNGRFGHPEQNRAISLREGATLQTFDIDYKFISKSIVSTARIIGNAVPPLLAKKIALSIIKGK